MVSCSRSVLGSRHFHLLHIQDLVPDKLKHRRHHVDLDVPDYFVWSGVPHVVGERIRLSDADRSVDPVGGVVLQRQHPVDGTAQQKRLVCVVCFSWVLFEVAGDVDHEKVHCRHQDNPRHHLDYAPINQVHRRMVEARAILRILDPKLNGFQVIIESKGELENIGEQKEQDHTSDVDLDRQHDRLDVDCCHT